MSRICYICHEIKECANLDSFKYIESDANLKYNKTTIDFWQLIWMWFTRKPVCQDCVNRILNRG